MMYQGLLKIDEINPDTINIKIAWEFMIIGSSVFIPCINTNKAKNQLRKIFKNRGWSAEIRVRIENGIFGVRIWRIL